MTTDPGAVNRAAMIVGTIATLLLVWCALAWVGSRGVFALRDVRVLSPLVEVDAGLLESAIRTDLRGTFFSIAPNKARATLRKLPWVRDVTVRRRWPLGLDLSVEEYRAVGYWGDSEILSDRGDVFRAASKAPMPRFDGPLGSAPEVLARYHEARVALATHGIVIKALSQSPRGAISVVTDNGMQMEFGREHYQERLARFVALFAGWPPAFRATLARVDLRYKAAVAVARGGAAAGGEIQKGQS